MALVTISGFPCSGKTIRAQQICTSLEQLLQDESYQGPLSKVVLLSDDMLDLSRSAYDGEHNSQMPQAIPMMILSQDSRTEKPARGSLFTAMQRQMALDTILIVDALNYIKGFRYQMYCAAREMKLRVCTVCSVPLLCTSGTHRRIKYIHRSTSWQLQTCAESGTKRGRMVANMHQKRASIGAYTRHQTN